MKTKLLFYLLLTFFFISYSQSDTTHAVIESFDILTDPLNLTAGDGELKFSFVASDDLSGAKRVDVAFYKPDGTLFIQKQYTSVVNGELFEGSFIIAQFSQEGEYFVGSINIWDKANNFYRYNSDELKSMGFKSKNT